MRVAVVAQAEVAGGAEAYLARLCDGLIRRGNEVRLFGRLPGWQLPMTDMGLGPKWGRATVAEGVTRLPAERRVVTDAVSAWRPDVVHMQFKREQLGLTSALARVAPVVWTEHGRFPVDHGKRVVLSTAYRWAARHVSTIICVSDMVAHDVVNAVGRRCRVVTIENAIDTQALQPPSAEERERARRQLGLVEGDGPVMLWIGRLAASKLPLLAVQTAGRWPGITLIAGDGPERGPLERAANGHRVRLLGHLRDPTVAYRAADVFLFTSTGASEGFPTTVLEAAAHGVALVGNRDSGAERILLAAGGEVRPADPIALAEAAMRVLEQGRGPLARKWSEQHDVRSWLDRHDLELRTALKEAR